MRLTVILCSNLWPHQQLLWLRNFSEMRIQMKAMVADSLKICFNKYKPNDIDEEEAKVIIRLIYQVSKYDPSERPCAAEILSIHG